jgi:hypothetical protein
MAEMPAIETAKNPAFCSQSENLDKTKATGFRAGVPRWREDRETPYEYAVAVVKT